MRTVEKWSSLFSRVLFLIAFGLAGVAVWEKLANVMGYELTFVADYAPSRLLEWAVTLLIFVIAVQLRELRRGPPHG